MLYTMKEILADAQKKRYGVGYFNGVNMEMTRAYIRAAEDTQSPIIIGTAEGLLPYAGFAWIGPLMLQAARNAHAPVAVHLDHAYTFDVIMQALAAGFGSVMFDGSALPYNENVRISADISKVCHPMGVGLECELGKVGGLPEEDGKLAENIYTDPANAADFAAKTGVDFLAVSVGTVHGVYKTTPKLDLDRLAAIKAVVNKPLVLHGGSGLTDADFKNCISGGICKVNIYTDIITAAIEAVRANAAVTPYTDMNILAENAMYEATMKKIRIFGSNGKA
jgi:fructose-bisphosphate aldolase class II